MKNSDKRQAQTGPQTADMVGNSVYCAKLSSNPIPMAGGENQLSKLFSDVHV